MKRYFLTAMVATCCTTAFAQYRQVTLPEKSQRTAYKDHSSQDTGFWCAVDVDGGSSLMYGKTNMQYTNLLFTGGYRINEFLRVGAGLGLRTYVHNNNVRHSDSPLALPLFVNTRGNILSAMDREAVPFWSVNAGGVVGDGFLLNPTLGYSFGGSRHNFLIGLSYTLSSFTDLTNAKRTYSYLGVTLGYEF